MTLDPERCVLPALSAMQHIKPRLVIVHCNLLDLIKVKCSFVPFPYLGKSRQQRHKSQAFARNPPGLSTLQPPRPSGNSNVYVNHTGPMFKLDAQHRHEGGGSVCPVDRELGAGSPPERIIKRRASVMLDRQGHFSSLSVEHRS